MKINVTWVWYNPPLSQIKPHLEYTLNFSKIPLAPLRWHNQNLTPCVSGVERVCDLVDANKVGASPTVEQSIRKTVDKVAAIGSFFYF